MKQHAIMARTKATKKRMSRIKQQAKDTSAPFHAPPTGALTRDPPFDFEKAAAERAARNNQQQQQDPDEVGHAARRVIIADRTFSGLPQTGKTNNVYVNCTFNINNSLPTPLPDPFCVFHSRYPQSNPAPEAVLQNAHQLLPMTPQMNRKPTAVVQPMWHLVPPSAASVPQLAVSTPHAPRSPQRLRTNATSCRCPRCIHRDQPLRSLPSDNRPGPPSVWQRLSPPPQETEPPPHQIPSESNTYRDPQ